ncbi:transposase, partial [Rhodococcus sp. T2V]|uniref:transposase n=1 Tax=Rhodococcus sp. T2V TaxID=3034164 RepID=UPI0023E259CF
MTDTLRGVENTQVTGPAVSGNNDVVAAEAVRELSAGEQRLVADLVRQARAEGVELTGRDGLLKALTKSVLEAALDEEMTEHLGYDKHAAAGRGSGNSRNGSRTKRVLTDACGEVTIEVPRDRNGSFTPQIVPKRQRRLFGVDEVVLSLYAKGLTTPPATTRHVPRSTTSAPGTDRCSSTSAPASPTRSTRWSSGPRHAVSHTSTARSCATPSTSA